MSRLVEQGYIEEIKNGNNFEYVLADNAYFIDTDYRVMQNAASDYFIKSMKISRNGKTDLLYITDDYKPVWEMRGIDSDVLLVLMSNILSALIKAKENGFFRCVNIDFSKEKIYVNPNTFKVKLTYLPLSISEWNSEEDFDEGVRGELVEIINVLAAKSTRNLELFVKDICSRTMTLEDVYRRVVDYQKEIDITPKKTSIELISMDPWNELELLIDSDVTTLGKKQELVDKAIPFNSAISRKHCQIIREHDMFYVMDDNSANGTFVNNNRVMPGEKYPLNIGDILRLANSDFTVK